uniref:Ig-like domain-containing protein n=1 Tax=Sphaeramia orbicularis TaxID=375764 RepID=A0A672YXY5_9TELE
MERGTRLGTGIPSRIGLKSQQTEEGSSVVLHCELSKKGVLWRKEGELLKNGDKYQMRKKELQAEMKMTEVSLDDTGDYTCICGEERTTATIRVNGKYWFYYAVKLLTVLTHIQNVPYPTLNYSCETQIFHVTVLHITLVNLDLTK